MNWLISNCSTVPGLVCVSITLTTPLSSLLDEVLLLALSIFSVAIDGRSLEIVLVGLAGTVVMMGCTDGVDVCAVDTI